MISPPHPLTIPAEADGELLTSADWNAAEREATLALLDTSGLAAKEVRATVHTAMLSAAKLARGQQG